MKLKTYTVIALCIFTLSYCATSSHTQSKRNEFGNSVVDINIPAPNLMRKMLALGQSKEIKNRQFEIKLYSVPIYGQCVTDQKSICAHHYLLSVATKSKDFQTLSIHDLGLVGEITRARLINDKQDGEVNVVLEISNYPTQALRKNKKLLSQKTENFLKISGDEVTHVNSN